MTEHPWFHTPPDTRQKEPIGDSPLQISVILDRSGSMGVVADDIVGGFNGFLADQRTRPGEVRVTLAQFDSQDPFEVLIDAAELAGVPDLDRAAYQPRGCTPLYDAVGQMIERIDTGIAERGRAGLPEEDHIVAIVTDGLENASHRHTRRSVFRLIEERRRSGWVFVFLGANQDSFATGRGMAIAPRNRADWESSPEGSKKVWRDLSHSSHRHRAKAKAQRLRDRDAFYEEDPAGERE